jgi:chlorophyll synthase
VSLLVAWFLGPVVMIAAVIGLLLAWAYSAPPIRLKQSPWYGYAACGACYEGLPWITGVAVLLAGAVPDGKIFIVAALYSAGAHGIMILNDFKSVDGDSKLGLNSLPVVLGAGKAARIACVIILVPQLFLLLFLWYWDLTGALVAVGGSILLQMLCMRRLLKDPLAFAPWYNASGVSLYVLGMMATAIALRSIVIH